MFGDPGARCSGRLGGARLRRSLAWEIQSMLLRVKPLLVSVVLLTLAGCDETDAVAVRIKVRDDLSGQVTTSNVAPVAADTPLQQASQGVDWSSRAEIVCSAGKFAALSQLKIADIGISSGDGGEGFAFVRLSLPRGENAQWHKLLVPMSTDERQRAAAALDPSGKTKNVAATIKFEIELPSTVVGNGLFGRARGMKLKAEGPTATLIVPLEIATTAGDPIVWHLTWQR
jgi:hypothetical protein